MRGRKPKPTALKELEGNPGKRPLNDREPQFRRTVPRCPSHLGDVARKEWKRTVHELAAVGLLTGVDRASLAAYCQLYARWVDAEEQLKKTGLTITTSTGYVLPHPLVAISNAALEGMRKFMVEFGMTPSSRSRLKVNAPEKEKSLEQQLRDLLGSEEAVEDNVDAESH